jgi:hypothetical protein
MITTTNIIQVGKMPNKYNGKDVYRQLDPYYEMWDKFAGIIHIKAFVKYFQLIDESLGNVDDNRDWMENWSDPLMQPWPYGNKDYERFAKRGVFIDPSTGIVVPEGTPGSMDQWDAYSSQPVYQYVFRGMEEQFQVAIGDGIV